MESFSEFGLSEQVLKNLEAKQYKKPTEVQIKAIPLLLEKKDLVIQSHTGSGKTAAFALPIIEGVMAEVPAVQFLILVPTRELAAQVGEEIGQLSVDTGAKHCAIYGGADMSKQVKALRNGAQIVVGTPGRIMDHLKRRTLNFSVVRGVVLDEADKMLSMGFFQDVQTIFSHLPKRRQMIMSSATFPYSIEQLIYQYMVEPQRITLSTEEMMPSEILHYFCSVANNEKEAVLLALLEKEQPELSLIFCNTKADVRSIHVFLTNAGITTEWLSSEMSQSQREKALQRLKTGASRHMVCTDLAARGIDIPTLSHVFVYSASGDAETYVHRTGRTGRAGRAGKAISLVSTLDLAGFQGALRLRGISAEEIQTPTDEEIAQARLARGLEHFESIDFAKEADVHEAFLGLAKKLDAKQVATLLPFLLEHYFRPRVVVPVEAPPVLDEPGSSSRSSHSGQTGRGSRERGPRRRDREERRGRPERGERRDRPGRSGGERRDRPGHGERREREGARREPLERAADERSPAVGGSGRKSKVYSTVCLALGRLDGIDEMDIQNILRRQGKARMEDIGDIAMKDHESFINIGENSLAEVLASDGRHFKSFELFISKSPISLEPTAKP